MSRKSLKSLRRNCEIISDPAEEKSSTNEWLKKYYDQAGREIGVAFGAINANTGWAITLLSILVTGIFLSGIFPDIRSFIVLLLISLLLIRFFARTVLAYQNLIRWNIFRNSIDKIFLGEDRDGSIQKDLRKSIDLYDWRWLSPQPRSKLILSNLRYGYWYMFLFIYLLAAYAWLSLDTSSILAPSPNRSWAIAAILVTASLSLVEIKGFFDVPYFKYIRSRDVMVEQDRKQASKKRGVLQGKGTKRCLYFFAAILLVAAVLSLAWTETRTIIVKKENFTVGVHEFALSSPIALTGGEEISFEWFAESTATVIIADIHSIQHFNQTGELSNLIEMAHGQSGSATAVVPTASKVGLLVSADALDTLTGELQVRKTPNAWIGLLIGPASFAPLLAATILQASSVRREEIDMTP